jgi:hypothetical protein
MRRLAADPPHSLATIDGALGAAVESDVTVLEAAYGLRPANHDDPTAAQN